MPADDIERSASEWLARMDRAAIAEDVRAEFEAWYAADPRHQLAYLRLQHTWTRMERLAALRLRHENQRARHASGLRHWLARAVGLRYVQASVAIAALAFGVVLLMPEAVEREIHSTSIGGFERIALQDGSLLELNTQTEVAVELTARARSVRLIRGEANFKVAHDAKRPFVVTVDDMAVRAVGTEFNVRRRAQSIEMLVIEGKVAVGSPQSLNAGVDLQRSVPVLPAGSIAIAARSGLEIRVLEPAEARRRVAWRAGMLSFDGQTLDEAAAEFGRYDRRQLVIDPRLSSLRIGGQFRATNLEGFVSVLERSFGVQARIEADRIVLRRGEATADPPPPVPTR